MNAIVIYKSRTGFTKQYAEWISEELSCETADYEQLSKLNLDSYELIIYGGRLHAGKIDSLEKVKKLFEKKRCKLVVFATGATPAEEAEEIEKVMRSNFSNSSIPHFYMQSGLCYEKMGFADKTLMTMLSKLLSGKDNKSEFNSGMAAAISQSHDIYDRSYIMPLIDYVRKTKF